MGNTSGDGNKPRNFDDAATSWDDEPRRVRLASEVAAAIRAEVGVTRYMTALDYGCGTGLVTLCLQPHVGTITGADTSDGMLQVLREKVASRGVTNVATVHLEPDQETFPSESFDLLVSSMTLHHVEDVAKLLVEFYRILRPGGVLAIADLDAEDGSFHGHGLAAAHSGFDRERMRVMLVKAGFRGIRDTTAATVEKNDAAAEIRTYTVFLMTAEK